MADEIETGSAGAPDGGGPAGGGSGEQSPLQSRAAFIKNWDWQLVTSLNRGACARGSAQHGFNSKTHRAVEKEWDEKRRLELTLDFLKHCHRRAPFLFFNGNTFSDIGRRIAAAVFSELPAGRLRETTSAIAHYIAGVVDRESMVAIVESLCVTADLQPGDRVQTLRGTVQGKVLRILLDGRVIWQPEGTDSKLAALPESLVRKE